MNKLQIFMHNIVLYIISYFYFLGYMYYGIPVPLIMTENVRFLQYSYAFQDNKIYLDTSKYIYITTSNSLINIVWYN